MNSVKNLSLLLIKILIEVHTMEIDAKKIEKILLNYNIKKKYHIFKFNRRHSVNIVNFYSGSELHIFYFLYLDDS